MPTSKPLQGLRTSGTPRQNVLQTYTPSGKRARTVVAGLGLKTNNQPFGELKRRAGKRQRARGNGLRVGSPLSCNHSPPQLIDQAGTDDFTKSGNVSMGSSTSGQSLKNWAACCGLRLTLKSKISKRL